MSESEIFHRLAKYGAEDIENYVTSVTASMGDSSYLRSLINKRNSPQKYTPLHVAIFSRNMDAVKAFVSMGADLNMKCHGTPSIHLALSTAALPGGFEFGMECFSYLLSLPSSEEREDLELMSKDDQGYTALHVACEYDFAKAAEALINSRAGSELLETKDRLQNRPIHSCACNNAVNTGKLLLSKGVDLTAKNVSKSSALHVAASSGSSEVWKLLLNAGADMTAEDLHGRIPESILQLYGWKLDKKTKEISRILPLSMPMTAIVTHSTCRKHYTCAPSDTETNQAPPENKKRLEVAIDEEKGALRSIDLKSKLKWIEECRPATISDVLRVHEWPYVRLLESRVEGLPFDPETDGGIGSLDGDTTVSRHTYEAALHAAGAVCQGVDMVLDGSVSNAFCPVRPPGHHAGPKGLVKGEPGGPDSHGFCLLNNLSIGAAYAMNVHRDKVKRVAMVDFDVHNGNGTAETVRWLKPLVDQETVANPYSFGSFVQPRYKPWLDKDDSNNVMFVSVHGYGPREAGLEHLMPAAAFYPGSGSTEIPDVSLFEQGNKSKANDAMETENNSQHMETTKEDNGEIYVEEERESEDNNEFDANGENENEDEDDDDEDHEEGNDESEEESVGQIESNDRRLMELRKAFIGQAQKVQQSSMPPLILNVGVSLPDPNDPVGSYRHQWRNYFRQEIFPRLMDFKPDIIFISAGFDAHKRDEINGGYIALVEEDFEWVTDGLMRIANSCCKGRVVSSLEGGYQISGEYSSAFAKSIKFHVNSMAKAAKCVANYDFDDAKREMELEANTIQEMEARRIAKQEAILKRKREEIAAREALLTESAPGDPTSAPAGGEGLNFYATSSPPDMKKSRRAASKPIDYVALSQKMDEEKAAKSALS